MTAVALLRRRAVLLLLLVALTAWLCVDATGHRRTAQDQADHDEEEDEDDEWDFLSDASVVAAADTQRRAVPCAASLAASYLNDNYCDCADGSDEPETSACALVTHPESRLLFQCKSTASDGQRVDASWVHDGVCDCCDGSDEPRGVCSDTCTQRRHARLDRLRDRQQLVRTARGRQAESAALAATRVQKFRGQFDEIAGRATALQRAFQYKQQQLEAQVAETGASPSEAEIDDLRRMYAQANHWQYHAYVHSKLVEPETFDASAGRESFATLVGACFTHTVNEKQLKGGSSNVLPRTYVIVFCPFQNVTQTEPGYGAWQRAERESKTGVRESHVDEDDASDTQPAISMGVWDHWMETLLSTDKDVDGETNDKSRVILRQRFAHGDACANGQERVVNVEVVCGSTNRVLSVEEPAMCEYALRFETPMACSALEERALAMAIQLMAENDAKPSVESHGHEEL